MFVVPSKAGKHSRPIETKRECTEVKLLKGLGDRVLKRLV
jgi:hypothetical protein